MRCDSFSFRISMVLGFNLENENLHCDNNNKLVSNHWQCKKYLQTKL